MSGGIFKKILSLVKIIPLENHKLVSFKDFFFAGVFPGVLQVCDFLVGVRRYF